MLRNFYLKLKQFINPNMASLVEANANGKRSADTADDTSCKKQRNEGLPDRKRKVALLIAYNGKGYYGLQINPGLPTIESTILKALLEVGVIPQEHHDVPQKMSFQRAARTDKGVSAAGNLLSLKMLLNVENLIDKINEQLPPRIKVFDCIRTTNGFNCKNHCSGRTYMYLLPTYAMAPVEETCTLEYRTNVDILERMNEILEKYIGTHNFHNFTSGIKAHEATAKRYIKQFQCGLPFVEDGVEFCVISVTGQSFVLHQIRKMVGLAIAVVKGIANEDCIDLAFQHEKVSIPIAPGLGLVLDKLHYDQYNLKWASDGTRAKLDFGYLKDKLEPFKNEFILSSIIKEEIETQSMMQWLPVLFKHSFDTEENYDGRRFPSGNSSKVQAFVEKLKESSTEESKTESLDPAPQAHSDKDKAESLDLASQEHSDKDKAESLDLASQGHSDKDKAGSQTDVEESRTGTSLCSDSSNQNECNKESSQTDCVSVDIEESTATCGGQENQSEEQSKVAASSSSSS